MYSITADGKEIIVPGMCSHCNLDTGGRHQTNCPMVQGYKSLNVENVKLAEELFPVDIEDWPSWD